MARQALAESLGAQYPRVVAGDAGAASQLFAKGAVLHVPGRSVVSDDYRGPDGIASYFAKMAELSGGTLKIELGDVSGEDDRTIAWQSVAASRAGGAFSDEQCLRIRGGKDGIEEVWLYPSDLEAHDEFWGSRSPPIFSPEDRTILTRAFREGTAPTRASGPNLLVALLLAISVASLVIVSYRGLRTWRPPATLSLTTDRAADLKHVTLSGDEKQVTWTLESAYARGLSVIGPEQGTVEVILPVAGGECAMVASELGGECVSGRVALGTPVDLEWDSTELISSTDARGYAGSALDVAFTKDADETLHVALLAAGPVSPSLCFSSPLAPTNLTVHHGADQVFWSFTGEESSNCTQSLRLIIGAPGGEEPPTARLDGVQSVQLDASGPTESVQGLIGQAFLSPGGTKVFASSTELVAEAKPGSPFMTTLDFGPGKQSLTTESTRIQSLQAGQGELVPSEWDRNPGVIVPILGGLVGVGVVAPLGVVVSGLTVLLSRLKLPKRRKRNAPS
jgi:ketosteroid isomerase-like protein